MMARQPKPPASVDFDSFVADATRALLRTQSLLRAALVSVLPLETGARACGRALGISRHLGWQAWSLAFAPDAALALSRLPGPGGWRTLLSALADRGRPAAEIDALRAAVAALNHTVAAPASEGLLQTMAAGGLATSVEAAAIVKARRLSRTAAEMLQGVRCGLNAGATVIGPADSKRRCDIASASLFEGLSRSRPGRAWPIYRWSLQGAGEGKPRAGGKAITPSRFRPLLPDLSTPRIETLGEIRRVDRQERASIEFSHLDPSRSRGLRLAFAEAAKGGGTLGADGEVPTFGLAVSLPLQLAVFDLLLHRSLPQSGVAAAAIYSPLDPMLWARNGSDAVPIEESCRLPFEREPRLVESLRLPAKWRSCSDAYGEAVGRAAAAIARDLSEFTITRIEVPDPPLHGVIAMRWR